MFRLTNLTRASGGGGYTFSTSSYSSTLPSTSTLYSSPILIPTGGGAAATTSFKSQKNFFSTKKLSKKSNGKISKRLPTSYVTPSSPTPPITSIEEKKIINPRPWPARTAQGYICKHCSSLGRGNYCDKHKEMKDVSLMTTPSSSSTPGSGLTKFAKNNPSLTFAALCLLQHVADSPIAQ